MQDCFLYRVCHWVRCCDLGVGSLPVVSSLYRRSNSSASARINATRRPSSFLLRWCQRQVSIRRSPKVAAMSSVFDCPLNQLLSPQPSCEAGGLQGSVLRCCVQLSLSFAVGPRAKRLRGGGETGQVQLLTPWVSCSSFRACPEWPGTLPVDWFITCSIVAWDGSNCSLATTSSSRRGD